MRDRWLSLLVLCGLSLGCGDASPPRGAPDAVADDGAPEVATADAPPPDSVGFDARRVEDAAADADAEAADIAFDLAAERAAMDVASDARAALDAPRDAPMDAPTDGRTDAPGPTGIARPFGSHPHTYAAGSVTPSRPRAAMDASVASLYDRWKAAHLRQRCGAGRYLVDTAGDTTGATVSEAHGWGMVIVVYMAGHDPDARRIFDGMVRYYRDHPSAIEPALMAWAQGSDCRDIDGADAATDGDLDIAYALLLAERQWGDGGAFNYGALARRSMAAIARREVHPTARTLLVGDWATEARWRDGTRLSDFMFDHLRSFRAASGDAVWDAVLGRSYEVATTLQEDFTSDGAGGLTGLLPDFALGMNARAPRPAPADWLESTHDGRFYWNACRTPWRVAADFLLHGEVRSRDLARRMTGWVRRATGDMPTRVATGYRLDGARIGAGPEMAFVAPFAAAAAVDAAHQPWLDALWRYMVETPFTGSRYFGNTIRLHVMLTVSRNAWPP